LKEIKSFYLLGDADFWYLFVKKSKEFIKKPLSEYKDEDIKNGILNEVFHHSINTKYNPELINRISINIQSNGFIYEHFNDIKKLFLFGSVIKTNPDNHFNKSYLSL